MSRYSFEHVHWQYWGHERGIVDRGLSCLFGNAALYVTYVIRSLNIIRAEIVLVWSSWACVLMLILTALLCIRHSPRMRRAKCNLSCVREISDQHKYFSGLLWTYRLVRFIDVHCGAWCSGNSCVRDPCSTLLPFDLGYTTQTYQGQKPVIALHPQIRWFRCCTLQVHQNIVKAWSDGNHTHQKPVILRFLPSLSDVVNLFVE